jgi:hypothetical protein
MIDVLDNVWSDLEGYESDEDLVGKPKDYPEEAKDEDDFGESPSKRQKDNDGNSTPTKALDKLGAPPQVLYRVKATTAALVRKAGEGRKTRIGFLHKYESKDCKKTLQISFYYGDPKNNTIQKLVEKPGWLPPYKVNVNAAYSARQVHKMKVEWMDGLTIGESCQLVVRYFDCVARIAPGTDRKLNLVVTNSTLATKSHMKQHLRSCVSLIGKLLVRNLLFGPDAVLKSYDDSAEDLAEETTMQSEWIYGAIYPLSRFLYTKMNSPEMDYPFGKEGITSCRAIYQTKLHKSLKNIMEKAVKWGSWSTEYVYPLIKKTKKKGATVGVTDDETIEVTSGLTTENQYMTRGVYYPLLRMLVKIVPDFPYNEDLLYLTYNQKRSLEDKTDAMDKDKQVVSLVHHADQKTKNLDSLLKFF